MKAGAVIRWLSELDPEEHLAIIWWTREDIRASLELDTLEPEQWENVVDIWDKATASDGQEMYGALLEIAGEVTDNV